ncbi:hypothetical protein SAMN05421858_5082 [Haladaptatus litoreus]|uniref:Uncharacterized protein n=1 Tax=Haladaptatus litoreus TaxID=553468 RepID=A0A1N7FHY2_9EURY|nr:hypothetical protein [Haladaptatus litoreus]SIR99959.1 hypothetical protein SAMN05421858_5082 [Haladaptatus litoreus]
MSDDEDLQRTVDEAVGEMNERENVIVGEPMTVSDFAEMLKEAKEDYDNGDLEFEGDGDD